MPRLAGEQAGPGIIAARRISSRSATIALEAPFIAHLPPCSAAQAARFSARKLSTGWSLRRSVLMRLALAAQ